MQQHWQPQIISVFCIMLSLHDTLSPACKEFDVFWRLIFGLDQDTEWANCEYSYLSSWFHSFSSGMQQSNILERAVFTQLEAFTTSNGGLIQDCSSILSKKHFHSTYRVLGILLSILQVLMQLILIQRIYEPVLYSPPFFRQKIEAQKVSVIYLRSHRWQVADPRFQHRQSDISDFHLKQKIIPMQQIISNER